nr:MAG TPA: hypothetical protein [Caudoviricetes sp.]
MSDNYAVINGTRVELTDDQVKVLGIETRNNPFDRVEQFNKYYRVTAANQVDDYVEVLDSTDNRLYDVANYFNDKDFANQVALHQLLYRNLLKFAYDNGCEDTEWDLNNRHYYIIGSFGGKNLGFDSDDVFKRQGTVYFSSKDGAIQAINEVVKPFMKEHPEFVW